MDVSVTRVLTGRAVGVGGNVSRGSLVVGAEERVALFTLWLVLVEELVECIEVLRGGAVKVVPPVADEVLLVEDGAVGAQEAVEVSVSLAHVKYLTTQET